MNILSSRLRLLMLTAALAALPYANRAGIYSFAEYGGLPDNAAIDINQLPQGNPDGTTASWVGFQLHTTAGDDPMSVFPTGDQAVLSFSPPVTVQSINAYDTEWGDPMTVIGKLHGLEVWRHPSPGDGTWARITTGAGKEVDQVVFVGKFNHYDNIEVEAAPDSDFDSYTDADEIATGYDPNNFDSNPGSMPLADSVAQFGGVQGDFDWYYGIRNYSKDGGGPNYDPETGFIPFTEEMWTGSLWDIDSGSAAPWTVLGVRDLHPNAGTGDTHWPIRRWVANQIAHVTPLAFRWHAHHANVTCGGDGITGALYRNGQLLDSAVIPGPDAVGVTRTYYVNAAPGDRFDLVLSAKGTEEIEADGCDGSQNWLLVNQTIPDSPLQPDGSFFVPVGTGDTDGDEIPDVWEESYFPNDLTKLSRTGDSDQDGLNDLGEYQRSSDPTKPDTDGDGLGDAVETKTGVYVSKTDTGSHPAKTDSDGDGLPDAAEVNRTPPTNPNKADSDGDGFSDSAEIGWGTSPTDAKDDPTTFVIANSEKEFSGVQGRNGWFSGYRVFDPTSGATNYNASSDFIPFPGGEGMGEWDGYTQTWSGAQWDLNTDAAAPWTEIASLAVHPNGTNNAGEIGGVADPTIEHWPVRRWVATELTKETAVTIVWSAKKQNTGGGDGVSGYLFINGNLVDSKSIAGTDNVGEIRRYGATLKPNDIVDLALGPNATDGWDGSQTWLWIDGRALVQTTPTLSVTRSVAGITLTFTGTLQSADKVEGAYTDVNATSPLSVPFSDGSARFYRAKGK